MKPKLLSDWTETANGHTVRCTITRRGRTRFEWAAAPCFPYPNGPYLIVGARPTYWAAEQMARASAYSMLREASERNVKR